MPSGTYTLSLLNTNLSDRAGNLLAASISSSFTVLPTLTAPPNKALTYNDADGQMVTVKLTGPGTLQVTLGGPISSNVDAFAIALTGTTLASGLAITVAGKNGSTTIPTITVNGSLGSLIAPSTRLMQSLSVNGTTKRITLAGASGQISIGTPLNPAKDKLTLILGQVSELSISSNTPLAGLIALDWQDDTGPDDVVAAPWIGSLKVTSPKVGKQVLPLAGDFEADLNLSGAQAPKGLALGKVNVAGAVNQSTWTMSGHIGSITAAVLRDTAVDLGRTNNPQNLKYNLTSLTLSGTKNTNDPAFLRSRVYVSGKMGSVNLGRVNVLENVSDNSGGKQLGLAADRMQKLTLLVSGLNSNKPLKLKQLDTLADLGDPKKNPSGLGQVTEQLQLTLL
jgi:hypothetical protein